MGGWVSFQALLSSVLIYYHRKLKSRVEPSRWIDRGDPPITLKSRLELDVELYAPRDKSRLRMMPSISRRGVVLLALLLTCSTIAGTASVATADSASASLVTVNETVRVHPVEDAAIRGTTDLEPGANVSVRLQSAGETSPRFLKSKEVSVREDGSFVARFNLTRWSPGDRFSVTVVHNGTQLASADGKFVAQDVPVSPTGTDEASKSTLPGFGLLTAVSAICGLLVLAGWLRR